MTIDETVDSKMKKNLSLYERVALYVPGYRGYREKNLRREEDRAVRNEVARAMNGTKNDLADVQRQLVGAPELMSDAERIRTKVDLYTTKIKKSVNGYSGFHDAVKITESDLDSLVKWDAELMDGVQTLRKTVSELMDRTHDADCKEKLRGLERIVDSMMEAFDNRDAVMRGFEK